MNDSNKEYRRRMSKNGTITLAVAVILLAALILIDLAISALPANLRELDMTENKMYSVSDAAKREVAGAETAVDIYLFASGGEAMLADTVVHLDAFLGNLASFGKKVSYTLVDPLVDTALLETLGLTADTVSNLSVVVKSALRSRTIEASAFFSYYIEGVGKVDQTSAMYYYYYYNLVPSYVFDGESLVLGAINYVSDPNLPTIYTLSGHSESALSETLLTQLDAANINTATVTLSGLSALPSDCDMLVINAPQADLSDNEVTLLLHYLEAGGSIMMVTTPDTAAFPNLGKVAAAMGLSAEQGIIIETSSSNYYSAQAPYYLIPSAASHDITERAANVVLPFAHSIRIAASLPSGVSATSLYTTSSGAYMVSLDAETIGMPEGAEAQTFCVGAVAESGSGAKLIWIASNGFTADAANQVIGGGNYTVFTDMAEWVCGESDLPSVEPINMTSSSLTVSDTTAGMLSFILIIALPLAFVGYGLFTVIRRKRR